MKTLFLVGIGGAIGSIFRYLVSLLINKYFTIVFPLATFVVNVTGCFLIGLLLGYIEKQQITTPEFKLFFITGLCSGYTTFSAFAGENINLLQSNNLFTTLSYISFSIIVGLLSVWIGFQLSK